MNTGQKINLLKKLASGLTKIDDSDGDLVLRQFQFPSASNWDGRGGPYDYFLEMVEQGDEEKLLKLHEYLFPDDLLPGYHGSQEIENSDGKTFRLFASHSSTKKLFVTQIKKELVQYGIDCFIAHEDIKPTKIWLKEIKTHLQSCHALAAFLCKEFIQSEFCDQEVGFVLQRGVLIIPIRLEADPYGFMQPYQAVSVNNKSPAQIAKHITDILLIDPTTSAAALKAQENGLERLANEFLTSSNYGTSTQLLERLESYPHIPQSILIKILAGWEENDQIKGCNGIPWRMDQFIKKHNSELRKLPD